jgi:hypothetical protein
VRERYRESKRERTVLDELEFEGHLRGQDRQGHVLLGTVEPPHHPHLLHQPSLANCCAESGSEESSYLRLIDCCITQL